MCYSKTASLFALIVGTVLNIIGVWWIHQKYGQTSAFMRYVCLAVAWQWVLLMQLSEYLIWLEPNGGTTNAWGTILAKMFNITQPLVVFFALYVANMWTKDIPKWRMMYASMIAFAYFLWIVYVSMKGGFGNDLNIIPNNGECIWSSVCTSHSGSAHLHRYGKSSYVYYPWWRSAQCYGGTNVYFAALYPLVLLMLPYGFGLFTAGYIAGAMFTSAALKDRSRFGKGSAWCLYVLTIIVLNPLAYYLLIPATPVYALGGCDIGAAYDEVDDDVGETIETWKRSRGIEITEAEGGSASRPWSINRVQGVRPSHKRSSRRVSFGPM